jgi:hypothetical protein
MTENVGSSPRRDLFISHSSADVDIARELRQFLEGAGYSCWMAPDDIRGVDSWAEQILAAIEDSRVMVVLVSAKANGSRHVSREVNLALSRGRAILPVRVEAVPPAGALEYLLTLVQRVDAFPPPFRSHLEEIRSHIASVLDASPVVARDRGSIDVGGRRRRPLAASRPAWLAGLALVVVAVLLVAISIGLPPGASPRPSPGASPSPSPGALTSPSLGASTSPSPGSSALAFKRVSNPSGALSMEVPANWAAGPSDIVDYRTNDVIGPALTATENASLLKSWQSAGAVLGASQALATEFGLVDVAPSERVDKISGYLRSADWTLLGCVYEGESPVAREGYIGLYRRWRNCGQVGTFFWNMIAVPDAGTSVVIEEIQFLQISDSAIGQRILDTFEVVADRLPSN